MNRIRACIWIAALALLLVPQGALANDDFAGDWVLDRKRSEELGQLRWAKQTLALEDRNLVIRRTIRWGDNEPIDFGYTYETDGNEHHVSGPPPFERDVTAKWEGWGGKKLVVRWTFEVQGIEIGAQETWEMKSRGLRITRTFDTPRGERKQKLYFVRPEAAAE
jgi:hypothetical protein